MMRQYLGLPLPNPRIERDLPNKQWIFEAALEARASMLQQKHTAWVLWPIATVADEVAWRWCDAGRHGLIPGDAKDRAWLAAVITEILALDPVTREFLRSIDLPVPSCRSCRRRIGGVR